MGGRPNAMRLFYHPRGMRPYIVNWEATAAALIQWLHRDLARGVGDDETRRLLDELLSYPDVPQKWRSLDLDATPVPFLAVELRKDDFHLTFFSTAREARRPLRHHAARAAGGVLLPGRRRERGAAARARADEGAKA